MLKEIRDAKNEPIRKLETQEQQPPGIFPRGTIYTAASGVISGGIFLVGIIAVVVATISQLVGTGLTIALYLMLCLVIGVVVFVMARTQVILEGLEKNVSKGAEGIRRDVNVAVLLMIVVAGLIIVVTYGVFKTLPLDALL